MEFFKLFIVVCVLGSTCATQCPESIGGLRVFYDEVCANGGIGCNAGGVGQFCRFCGVAPFVDCPSSAGTTQKPMENSSQAPQNDCKDVGTMRVIYDESCSTTGGIGCNAGGQGVNCRFCGNDPFPPCPDSTTRLSSTTPQIQTQSTESTTRRLTSPRTPGSSSSGDEQLPANWKVEPDRLKREPIEHPVKRPSIVDSSYTGPLPTNSWYQNLLVGTTEQTLQLYPYLIQPLSKGLSLCANTKENFVVNNRYLIQPFNQDWQFAAKESFTSRKIKNLEALSVLLTYTTSTGSMEVPLVQGVPFITTVYTSSTPVLKTIRAILSVKVDDGAPVTQGSVATGRKFVIHFNSDAYWVVYSSQVISFRILASELIAETSGDYTLKVGLLGKTDASSDWDRFSGAHVESVDLSYEVNGDTAYLKYKWNTRGNGDVLMFAMEHHLDHLTEGTQTNVKSYSIKGELVGVSGDWTMEIPLSPISWYAPNSIDPSKVEEIRSALKKDQDLKVTAPDPYWFGLELGRSARLALIADQLGETAIATKIRGIIKEFLVPWLEGKNPNKLRYDTVWSGLVSSAGVKDAGADYGNGYYNDHHFHYGYPVYAAAVVGKEEPEFLEKYKNEINMYVRDYANPVKDDAYFIFTRNKDWFSWHSWAAGIYEFADNRNQESTSEAINGYYAIALLGTAAKNQYLNNFGRLMTAMEVISTKKYWQMPSYSTVYPKSFATNLMVGVLWSTKVEYSTFFGLNDEYIHGIQFLPFTPISEEYLDKRFMAEEKPFLDKNCASATEDWLGYLIEAKAVVDKENQWNAAKKLSEFHAGSSRTNVYYWIATR